jgi:hypothetical protein
MTEQERLLSLLSEPDAIMQPNIQGTVKEFVKQGGKPEDVVRALSSGYKGTAEACNLLSLWMMDVGLTKVREREREKYCTLPKTKRKAQEEIAQKVVDTTANRLRAVYDPNVTRHVFQTNVKSIPWMDFMVTKQGEREGARRCSCFF